METSNIALAYVVAELKPLVEGAFINSVQLVKDSVFKIKVHSKEHGTIDLLATPNALYRTNYKLPVQQAQSGFAAFLKKKLYNKRILSIEQHGFDRIIEMHFMEFDLVFELFAKGNVILKDKTGKIISCYSNEEWKDRKIRRNEQYKYPAAKPSITEISKSDFKKILEESAQDCVRAIVSALNVAPVAAEEACIIAGIEKQKKSAMLSEKEAKILFEALKKIYFVEQKKLNPLVVEIKGEKQLFQFPFAALPAGNTKNFSSLSEALDENLSQDLLKSEEKKAKKESDQKKARLQYSLAEQLKARQRLEKDEKENKKKAELVYFYYSEIKELVDAINRALEKKISKKEIMYKIKSLGKKHNQSARLLVDFNPKTKKLVLDLPDQ